MNWDELRKTAGYKPAFFFACGDVQEFQVVWGFAPELEMLQQPPFNYTREFAESFYAWAEAVGMLDRRIGEPFPGESER